MSRRPAQGQITKGKRVDEACEVKKVTKSKNVCQKLRYQAHKKSRKRQKSQKSAKIEKVKRSVSRSVGGK